MDKEAAVHIYHGILLSQIILSSGIHGVREGLTGRIVWDSLSLNE